jgi:hypothetical protein
MIYTCIVKLNFLLKCLGISRFKYIVSRAALFNTISSVLRLLREASDSDEFLNALFLCFLVNQE